MWVFMVLHVNKNTPLVGLSIERPILDHHPKAHVHEIRRISPWNQMFQQKLFWFYKVWGGFHGEIHRISPEIHQISWNLPDFIQISWNPPDFMKSAGFHTDFMWNRKTFARNCNSMFHGLGTTNESIIVVCKDSCVIYACGVVFGSFGYEPMQSCSVRHVVLSVLASLVSVLASVYSPPSDSFNHRNFMSYKYMQLYP